MNNGTAGTLVPAFDDKFVQLGFRLGPKTRGVVELLEHIPLFLRGSRQSRSECAAKRFQNRKNNAARLRVHGDSFYVIKNAVGKGVSVVVHLVRAQCLYQQFILDAGLGQKRNGQSGGIVAVQDVQAKILLSQLERVQAVHVLHHQIPKRHLHVEHRAFEQFEEERFGWIDAVVGKFTHLVNATVCRVLVGYRQNLVLVQRRIQRQVAQLRMKAVFVWS